MSYDLMVFDPTAAPVDRGPFLAWYEAQTEWAEGRSYDDPAVTTEPLRGWFFDMIQHFPAMNGPYASQEIDDERVSDYCIGRAVVYVAFAWSQVEPAYKAMFEKVREHGIWFYDVSGREGEVWLPRGDAFVCIHKNG
jgi:hypothetical protein